MKIAYFDESGTGGEPYAVMVAIVVDSQRMHKTKSDWNDLLQKLARIVGRQVTELHTRDFYSGNGPWRGLPGAKRAEIISAIIEWLNARKHELYICAISKEKYETERSLGNVPAEINTIWKALAFHVVLGIQKKNQKVEKRKGNTILIFDNEETERVTFANLISNPPAWSDKFYDKKKKQERLDQMVDVPYWADSEKVSLIQVADLICYIIRKYIEFKEGVKEGRYEGEELNFEQWCTSIKKSAVPNSTMYPSRGRCETADLYYKLAPDCIKNI